MFNGYAIQQILVIGSASLVILKTASHKLPPFWWRSIVSQNHQSNSQLCVLYFSAD